MVDLSSFSSAAPQSTNESQGLPSPSYQKLSLDEVKLNLAKKPSISQEPLPISIAKLRRRRRLRGCHITHIPYSRNVAPLPMNFSKCIGCRKRYVPEVLFATIDPPDDLLTVGSGQLVNALVCRPKKSRDGELNASTVGDAVPFLEYDLHRQDIFWANSHDPHCMM